MRAWLWLAAIAQSVCILEGARMTASQASQQRRVISRTVLGWNTTFRVSSVGIQQGPCQCGGRSDQRTLQEIASGDGAILPQAA